MNRLAAAISTLLLAIMCAPAALAVSPDERLNDPKMEAQARDISKILRCMVCQNQSIDDSDAGLAKDLRLLVRERLLLGDSPDEVIDHVTDIYGEYVLLEPRWGLHTLLLWLSPLLLFGFGAVLVRQLFNRRAVPAETSSDIVEPSRDMEAVLASLRERRDV